MRKKIVAGNWKMNTLFPEALGLAAEVKKSVEDAGAPGLQTIIAPPFPFLAEIAKSCSGTKGLSVAAQNCHHEKSGAYTGEVSAAMLRSCGVQYVIIGHSERRMYFGESGELLLEKTKRAMESELGIIFCIGESKEQRDNSVHFKTVEMQLEESLFKLDQKSFGKIILAYEPVWAIGTGVHATPEQAQEMHAYIRGLVSKKYGKPAADDCSLLYGGSCNAGNAGSIFSCADVDGGLIGGASLKGETFAAIRQTMLSLLK